MRQTTSLDDTSSLPSLPTFPSSAPDDLSTLLADAEKFRSKSPKKTGDEAVGDAIGQSIKGVISNIIAADFFLILAFLAWFLAGVVSSTYFKNDAIQLAFNGIFQPVVQPALGILMIGSIAGGAFGNNPDDADNE
ncbi:hypothetical protein TrCOL_g2525 [Triparma columacea]|uniref:Uncharacterized protein n=1 Tax=Triparma columacea TaxID=722753 RepID=A0A9W7G905_9STRA|nr:hypothetical protein TrCOL_g2525 [Triparma columacea]